MCSKLMYMYCTMHDLPVMEDREAEGLPLCVGSKVSFKAEGVDGRYERLYSVQWRAWDGGILGHMTSGMKIVHFNLLATV